MIKKEIQLSKEFKAQASKAILAIVFFGFTYLLIVLLAIALTALCIIGALFMVSYHPSLITLGLGLGLASIGIMNLIFVLKFIFSSNKLDRSHLVQIDETQEPQLFKMIAEIVNEVGTAFPKKVYLSSDVNASVFYDSTFWSMFLPVKKNLQIGLGLVNCITKEELKAILSHEFGHFSQRTMKVGSYVHNVNQMIFNMLYDNEKYDKLTEKWANTSGYFVLFFFAVIWINKGIKWILQKQYEVVNKSYLALSREMEFHADEIAASVTGFQPLKQSLLRMSLADNSFNIVLNFYDRKIVENFKSPNIYENHTAIIHLMAEENDLPIVTDLPTITIEEQSKYDKSKLVITDQWSSHPTTQERITRLEQTGFVSECEQDALANTVFIDIIKMQERFSDKIFENIQYPGDVKDITNKEFLIEYKKEIAVDSFLKIFNGYYDNKNPLFFELNSMETIDEDRSLSKFFSDEKVDLVYTEIALTNDIATLGNISTKLIDIRTFDYDGKKYNSRDSDKLILDLQNQQEILKKEIAINDLNIYQHFLALENTKQKPTKLQELYEEFFEYDTIFESKIEIYNSMITDLEFINLVTPIEQIQKNFKTLAKLEEIMRGAIIEIIKDEIFSDEITTEMKDNFEIYTSNKLEYIGDKEYFNENLSVLFPALNDYAFLLTRKYFLLKRAIVRYQESLLESKHLSNSDLITFNTITESVPL
ncbi:MAG: M48 family metalloprotease [Flavobacterium sp.]